jgi:hypothetical protein
MAMPLVLLGDDRQPVESELRAGEKLMWFGKPERLPSPGKSIFTSSVGAIVTSGVLYGITSAAAAIGGHDPSSFVPYIPWIFGSPFLFAGLRLLFRPLTDWLGLRKKRYAITTERCIVWDRHFFGDADIFSFRPSERSIVTRNQTTDGIATIHFAAVDERNSSGESQVTFVAVADAQKAVSELERFGGVQKESATANVVNLARRARQRE